MLLHQRDAVWRLAGLAVLQPEQRRERIGRDEPCARRDVTELSGCGTASTTNIPGTPSTDCSWVVPVARAFAATSPTARTGGVSSSSVTSAVIFLIIRAIDAMTAAGADGCGVGTRWLERARRVGDAHRQADGSRGDHPCGGRDIPCTMRLRPP